MQKKEQSSFFERSIKHYGLNGNNNVKYLDLKIS